MTTQDQAFCFNFVYPITLSYNNGTTITVNSADGLLEVLVNETNTLYIDGIAFPFQVQEEGTITTINSEVEFYELISGCANFQTVNDCFFDFTCYEVVYPILVMISDDQGVEVQNQAELMQLILIPPAGAVTGQLDIVFPISIIQNNQTIVIDNLYEFFEINNDCAGSSCVCTADFTPVCVQTTTGVVMYSNACFAMCDGFTQADFVSCDPILTTNFGNGLGSCFTMNYPVQVQHQGALVTANNDGELLQYYFPNQSSIPALVYPVTVNFNTPTGAIAVTVANQATFEAAIINNCN